MEASSCDRPNNTTESSSPCPPQSTESNPQASEKDASTMTIEFLRARLLSERSASKSARQQVHQMSQQLSNLQARLDMEIEQRKKAEGAMERMLKFFSTKGLSVDCLEKVEENLESIKEVDGHGAPSDALGKSITKHAVDSTCFHGYHEDSLGSDAHDPNNNNLVGKPEPYKSQLDYECNFEASMKLSSMSPIVHMRQNTEAYTNEFADKKSQTTDTTDDEAKLNKSFKLKSMLYQIMEEVKTIPKEQPMESMLQGLVDNVINLFAGKDGNDLCENSSKPYNPAHVEKLKDYSKYHESIYSKQKSSPSGNVNVSTITQSERCVVKGQIQNSRAHYAANAKGFDSQLKDAPLHIRQTMQDPCKEGKMVSSDLTYVSRMACHPDMSMHCAIPGSITEQAMFTNGHIQSSECTTMGGGAQYVVESPHPGMHYHRAMSYGEGHGAWHHGKGNEGMVKGGIIHDMIPHGIHKQQDVVYGNFGMHGGYAYHHGSVGGPRSLTDDRNGSRLGDILSVLQEARQCVRDQRSEDLLIGSSSSSSSSSLSGGYPHAERCEGLRRSRSVSSSSHFAIRSFNQNNLQPREVDLGNGITLYTD